MSQLVYFWKDTDVLWLLYLYGGVRVYVPRWGSLGEKRATPPPPPVATVASVGGYFVRGSFIHSFALLWRRCRRTLERVCVRHTATTVAMVSYLTSVRRSARLLFTLAATAILKRALLHGDGFRLSGTGVRCFITVRGYQDTTNHRGRVNRQSRRTRLLYPRTSMSIQQ